MVKDENFERWKSRVEFYLEQMAKKSLGDFDWYHYHQDYANKVPPEVTAKRVIQINIKRQQKV
jgi:hypothetical protein